MIHTRMAEDLSTLGIKRDDTILMHSSLSSLGHVEGGAETVIDTLLSVLEDGTLLIPALSFDSVNAQNPVFAARDTKSCVGAISEYFRTRPGVLRSLHPTHSVCGIGKNAEEILSHHIETDTPVGALSPFGLLPRYRGKILMLGCGLCPNTSMHGVEELTEPPYLYKPERQNFTLIAPDGTKIEKTYRVHNFQNTVQRYDRLAALMPIGCGTVLSATTYLIDAETMWKTANEKYKAKPFYFVDRLH